MSDPYENGYVTDLSDCARCGGIHDNLEFKPLQNPADDWRFWAMCPETDQPVLGAIVSGPHALDPSDIG